MGDNTVTIRTVEIWLLAFYWESLTVLILWGNIRVFTEIPPWFCRNLLGGFKFSAWYTVLFCRSPLSSLNIVIKCSMCDFGSIDLCLLCLLLLFYTLATVFQLYHGGAMMYEMRRRKPEPTLLLNQRILYAWYERKWPLMTLQIIHSGEMDCSRAKCYSSDQDSYPCPLGHLSHAVPKRDISPTPLTYEIWYLFCLIVM